jgi:hypothetical protein
MQMLRTIYNMLLPAPPAPVPVYRRRTDEATLKAVTIIDKRKEAEREKTITTVAYVLMVYFVLGYTPFVPAACAVLSACAMCTFSASSTCVDHYLESWIGPPVLMCPYGLTEPYPEDAHSKWLFYGIGNDTVDAYACHDGWDLRIDPDGTGAICQWHYVSENGEETWPRFKVERIHRDNMIIPSVLVSYWDDDDLNRMSRTRRLGMVRSAQRRVLVERGMEDDMFGKWRLQWNTSVCPPVVAVP